MELRKKSNGAEYIKENKEAIPQLQLQLNNNSLHFGYATNTLDLYWFQILGWPYEKSKPKRLQKKQEPPVAIKQKKAVSTNKSGPLGRQHINQ